MRRAGRATVVFVDEVHRFNKSQQDAFLPHVESGLFTFIGATTENPSFEVNSALLSRAGVHVLKALDEADLGALLDRADGAARRRAALDAAARAARRSNMPTAMRAGCSTPSRTSPRAPGRGGARRRRTRSHAGRDAAPRRQGRRRLLRHDLGAAQVGARLRPRRRAVLAGAPARRRHGPALRGAAPGAHGQRGHRPGRPARAAPGAGRGRGLRAPGLARRRAGAGRGRRSTWPWRRSPTPSTRPGTRCASSCAATARGRCRRTCAMRRRG